MKTINILFIALAISFAGNGFAQYSSPESAVFDMTNNRWLISNAGNGRILQRTNDGNISVFASNLGAPKGLTIVGDTLYVADETRIRAFRLANRQALYTVNVANSTFLNDVAADDNYLYVSDMSRHKISRMDLGGHEVAAYVTEGITSPNGLFFDRANNRLIVVSYRANSPVQAVNLEDGSVSVIINTQLTELDGIARDGNGNYYISSWGSGAVYRFRSDFSNQTMIEENLQGPADIFYNLRDNILAIPEMSDHDVMFRQTAPPEAQLNSPERVDYGEVHTFLRTEQRFEWRNSGASDLLIDSVQHSGEGFTLIVEDPIPLNPGEAVEIMAAFEPVDTIDYIDTVWIFSNEPFSPRPMILTGRGVPAPNLILPESHDFGRCGAGMQSSWEVELRNEGFWVLGIDSGSVRRGAGFEVRVADNLHIQPGESGFATIIFEPFALGDFGENAFFYSNDPTSPAMISLTGVGIRAPTLVMEDHHDFGVVSVGDSSMWEVSWRNNGDDTLVIDSIGNRSSMFITHYPDAWLIPAGEEFTSYFVYYPDASGLHQATINIFSNDPTSPKRIILSGEGRRLSVKNEFTLPKEFAISEGYPSPFNSTVMFQLSLPVASDVTAGLYDIQGRLVKDFVTGRFESGVHSLSLSGEGINAGTYFVKGAAGELKFRRKVVLLK